jgi:hypothetical protein
MIGNQAVKILHDIIVNGCPGFVKTKISSGLVLRESTIQ